MERIWFRLGRGRRTANLPPASNDARLGYDPLSGDPGVLSKAPLDRDLNDPVNSDGGIGKTSPLGVGGAAGLLGGDEVSGSWVTAPVSGSGLVFWLMAPPDVFGRSLVARGESGCWSVVGGSPSSPGFCTLETVMVVSSFSSVPSRDGSWIDISSPDVEMPDSKSAVSPDKTDPTEVSLSLNGPRCPAPGSLVRATLMVTVMSRSRVPMGLMGNHSASLIGSV